MKYIINVHQPDSDEKKEVWVEDGKVRYTSVPTNEIEIIKVYSDQFYTVPGKVMIDDKAISYFEKGDGISYIKHMLLYGFTTFIQRISIDYESETDHVLERAREAFKSSPLDYTIAISLPLSRVTESWIRKLKQECISIIILKIQSIDEMKETAWQRLVEAMFPKRILCIGEPADHVTNDQEKKEILDTWLQIVETFRMNSYLSLPKKWKPFPPLLLMRLGLYPQKGVLIMGSDADYMMYPPNSKEKPVHVPEVIVRKGKVIKAGKRWDIEEGSGRELTDLIPEKMISINDVHRYSDKH
ncbi:hypothetical protein LGQ02_08605 [Bacillus shivajii]|uniref:hypothetical protein n=1 Tax=Bacillus shivajii TaxID=1983719 RepID=UPI001CF9A17C|nr:hypothetical protein [Bacillus shivajii]UCZ54789.1 hypothetical protein LGQ02_08605 [Bacillus shivajii]